MCRQLFTRMRILKEISEPVALLTRAWQSTCSSQGIMVIIKSHLTSPPDGRVSGPPPA